ncbi:thiamine pyrophosphate-binding protein [Streptomyces sp. Je 1-4]|uniref:thiamine pyrophosphate-binding protein n=1 Tax=Streptomyces TaxID=1883 RepID=UPI002180BE26|nr:MULTISPECIES: thiamine pyrophosphate-binding protein [unclassified Streptomyces]UYB39188.1 thiamine pyrophosphate-binding protein [Streptomyces sp. Je 1-4]UZQ35202.1 thiamine pyrophosphate-binding protein [Streptomyces sp. Je 1-4] [Streptomyces sp. Je 1-4 4N24]UZQ42620.1 thiamine pyrophosphate-binding protein [Streptomyces sp. Je 1-4] [Streptomyces sp. Je 1-4 4N24_ara]
MAVQRIPAVRAAVQIMKDEGVETVFGCSGAALLPLYAAMEAGGIGRLPVRREEAAAHMAFKEAVSTRRPVLLEVRAV